MGAISHNSGKSPTETMAAVQEQAWKYFLMGCVESGMHIEKSLITRDPASVPYFMVHDTQRVPEKP